MCACSLSKMTVNWLTTFRRALRRNVMSSRPASMALQGSKAAQRTAFDIIVFDVMLPTIDGLEVTRRVRLDGVVTPFIFDGTGRA